jgi:hypothetical protein
MPSTMATGADDFESARAGSRRLAWQFWLQIGVAMVSLY